MIENDNNEFKSISWIRKNLNLRLKIINKIIKILNLQPVIKISKFHEETEYYDVNKIKEFIKTHDVQHTYSIHKFLKFLVLVVHL